MTSPVVRVDVTTLDGLVDEAAKQEMVEEITTAFAETAGLSPEQVLVVINVVPSMGAAGQLLIADATRQLAAAVTASA